MTAIAAASALDLGLLRVTVVAGSRRVDLAVPGVLPVAELIPELATALDLPTCDGLRLAPLGRAPLRDDRGLVPQGVPEAAVLVLASGELPPPVCHDDPAEALAAVVVRELPAWAGAPVLPVAGAGAAVVGLAAVMLPLVAALDAAVPPIALVAVTLAWLGLPTAVVTKMLAERADPRGEQARRAHRVIVVGGALTGGAAGLLAPAVVTGSETGPLLALAAGALMLLRCRRHRARDEVLVGLLAGAAVLAGLIATLLLTRPEWRLPTGLALTAAGAALGSLRLGWSPRLGLLADLLEQVAVVALLPLLVWSSGLLDRVPT